MGPILYMQTFSGPVRSVLLTAEALGLSLQKKIIDLSQGQHLLPDYLKLNPQHTIPTLVDNDTVIGDSHAINAYLVDKYGQDCESLYPKDLSKRALVNQRLHFDSGVIFPWLRMISRDIKYEGLREPTRKQIEAVNEGYCHLNTFLTGTEWVTGSDLTIADFSLIANVTTLNVVSPIDVDKYSAVISWLDKARELRYYDSANGEGLVEYTEMIHKFMYQ